LARGTEFGAELGGALFEFGFGPFSSNTQPNLDLKIVLRMGIMRKS
jgi:hypothetical protein